MANPILYRQITVDGDPGFVAPGTKLFTVIGSGRFPKIKYNLAVGQPVMYLAEKYVVPTVIDATAITAANLHRVRVGVGHNQSGGKLVDSIRYMGSEEIGTFDIEDLSTSSPTCGSDSVQDIYFDCVSSKKNYTLAISVRDNFTQTRTKARKDVTEYVFGYTKSKEVCVDCGLDLTCENVVDGLLENYRAEKAHLLPDGTPYPDYSATDLPVKFDVHKIHNRSLKYCLAFNAPAECEDCAELPSFSSATVGGNSIDLSGVTTATSDSAIYRSQLYTVVDLINEAFAADATVDGRAAVTGGGIHACCPMGIEVNTNDATFAIMDNQATPVAVTATETNPFAAGQPGEGFTCGIRVIGESIKPDASYIVSRPDDFLARKVKIEPRGDGFVDAKTAVISDISFPSGFGNMVRYQELYQTRGGDGRQYSGGYAQERWNGAIRKDSRLVAEVTAKGNKDYCSYFVRSRIHHLNAADKQDSRVISTYINVESDAATTIGQVEAILAKFRDLGVQHDTLSFEACAPLDKSC